jgi:LmbE family N-acetylglucosaminyl deacetylase
VSATAEPSDEPTPTRRAVLPVNELPPDAGFSRDLPLPGCALAVGAHPDDIEFGCGGTLAKWAAQGCRVVHLILTDGSKGTWDPGTAHEVLVARRADEARAAAAALGTREVLFLGRIDGELENGRTERAELSEIIRTVRPDVVLGHDPWRRYRLHPDHRHAGFIVTDAVVAARDPLFFPEQGLAPHRPLSLLLWEAEEPNHLESVQTADQKIAALLAHESQHQTTHGIPSHGDNARERAVATSAFGARIRAQLESYGRLDGGSPGEGFRLLDV